jgi:5-methyltetrahydrofolate--homocysteine methyltransferase
MEKILDTISLAVRKGNHEDAVKFVRDALKNGMSPAAILSKGLIKGIQALGELFKDGQVFLPEILISVRAMNRGLEALKPRLIESDIPKKGVIVLGTVEGDLHDIGKNLVRMMLEGNGYQVVDLGVDVKIGSFVDAVQKHKADILAMSSLLTTTLPYFRKVIEALDHAGIRNSVKVMVGGAPVTRDYADENRAEGFAEDCVMAVDEADRLIALSKGGIA